MKIAPQSGTTTSSYSNVFRSMDASTKYMGMIELSAYKKLRNGLFNLFDYVTIEAPSFFPMHAFISVWRVIQLLGPSFCCRYYSIWGEGTLMDIVTDILSVFYHIIPGTFRESISMYFLFATAAFFILMFILVFISSIYFRKQAKLPSSIPIIITIFFSTVGYILPPIATQFTAETIGRMISRTDSFLNVGNIVAVVLTLLVICVYAWLYASVYVVSITFKPDSLQTIIPSVQVSLNLIVILITFLTGIASEVSFLPRVILTGVSSLLYFSIIFILNTNGGVVSVAHLKAIIASAVCGGILFIIEIIFEFLNLKGTEVVLILYVGLWLICYFTVNVFNNRRLRKNLEILDEIHENCDNFEIIKSKSNYWNIVVDGFRSAHPVCLNWSLLKAGIERWPDNVVIWLGFSKFTAIYPEETKQLEWISVSMMSNHLKGSLAKHTLQQILTIMRQREANLIPEMKSKLDKVGKQVQATKHKVRYIWDLIIQGNIRELESVVARANKAIDQCEAEFQHLLRMFPNSRFVARTYARFLRDIVADHAAHKEWMQNVALLQRGIPVIPDKTHDLGIRAFPNMPKTMENTLQSQVIGIMTEDTMTTDIYEDEDQSANDAELRMSVRENINALVIPAYRRAKIIRLLYIIILFVAPVVALCIYIPIFTNNISTPLTFMESISRLRTEIFQLTAVAHHYVCEMNGFLTEPQYYGRDPPNTFGGKADSKGQLEYLADGMASGMRRFSDIMSFQKGDPDMDRVRDYMFQDAVEFVTIEEANPDVDVKESTSVQSAVMQYVMMCQELIKINPINHTIFKSKQIFTIITNIRTLTEDLTSALSYLRDYVDHTDTKTSNIVSIIEYVMFAFVIIVSFATTIFIVKNINDEKLIIYRCIASLPKNVVSRVADSFKVLKKDDDDGTRSTNHGNNEELNKQEENMLKIFATSSDTGQSNIVDSIILILGATLICALHVVDIYILCNIMISSGTDLKESAPHIDYIMASYSYDFAALLALNMMTNTFNGDDTSIRGYTIDGLVDIVTDWQSRGVKFYQAVRYGNSDLNVKSFTILGQGMLKGQVDPSCGPNDDLAPKDEYNVYKCWDPDLLTSFTMTEVRNFIHIWNEKQVKFDGNDPRITHLWNIHQVHLYNDYYFPLFDKVVPMVVGSLSSKLGMIIGSAIAIVVVAIIIEIVVFLDIRASEDRQKFALRLLLHCPGNIVVSNSNIMQLLAGNFTSKQIDSTIRTAEFYDWLVKDMPDAVIMATFDGTITRTNLSTQRITGIESNDLVGKNLLEFGERFAHNPFEILKEGTPTPANNTEQCIVFKKPDDTQVHLEIIFTVLQDSLLITLRDETQTVRYNQLIAEERGKSDQLLASILPSRLVSRVQAGEKNISFAVQSVTVTFIDIVSFTPWCGSNTAEFVMSTLNKLFKKFDGLVAMHPTMTKIKCIGDCYMAAGGIFAEVNQPASHAKDVVEFGLEAIQAIEELNKEIGTSLRIRVGVNTGGPIVAGVLGTEKPTFEILGPTINMAQQMEHHGIPMKVHVSRAVYEMIYGGSFDVKERGEIEVKNGTVVTYIVDKHQNKK